MLRTFKKWTKNLPKKSGNDLAAKATDMSTIERFEQNKPISTNLADNKAYIKHIFGDSVDLQMHDFTLYGQGKAHKEACLIYIDDFADENSIQDSILDPLKKYADLPSSPKAGWIWTLKNRINVSDIAEEKDLHIGLEAVLKKQALLLIHGLHTGLVIHVPGQENRALEEPPIEDVVRGPRIGFIESVDQNMAILRSRIHHPALRFEEFEVGTISKTKIILSYIDQVAHPEVINQVRKRLKRIDVDQINSSGDVEQMIEDHPFSLFPTVSNTERPDRATAQMLEGRFIILVDGDPIALVAPYLFMESFQNPDDYSSRPYYSSLIRLMRIIAFILSISFPALYIAALNFHKELIPSEMVVGMAASQEVVPFPVPMETFILITLFEIVREAGIRMPRPIGQAVSIVGALILGEVSVTAGLISAPSIIIVAFSTIASFAVTRVADVMAVLRIALLIPASLFGMYGLLISLLALATHMVSLQSFGVSYMAPIAPLHLRDWGDIFIRLPIHWLRKRTKNLPHVRERRIRRLPSDDQEEKH